MVVSTFVLDSITQIRNSTGNQTSSLNIEGLEATNVAQTEFGDVFVLKRESISSSTIDALVKHQVFDLAPSTPQSSSSGNAGPSSSSNEASEIVDDRGDKQPLSNNNAATKPPTVTLGVLTRSVKFRVSKQRRKSERAVPCNILSELIGTVQLTARFAAIVLSTKVITPEDVLGVVAHCENANADVAVVHFNLYLLWLNEKKNSKTGINNSAGTTAFDGGGTLPSNEMAAVLPQHAMSNVVAKLEVALDESSDSAASKLSPTRHSSQLTVVRNELQSIFSQKQAAWSSTPLTPVQARDVVMDPAMGLEATSTMTTMTTAMGTTTVRSVSTTSPTNLPPPTTSSSTLEPRYAADGPCAGETSSFGLIIFEDTNKVSTPNRETGMHGEAAAIVNQVNSLLFSFAFSRGEQGFSKIVCASGDRGVLWATLHISAHSTRAGCQLASDLLYEAVESQRRVFSLQNEAFPVLGFVPMECEQQEEENGVNSGGNDGNENSSRPGNAKDDNTVLTAASTPAQTTVPQELIATHITNANDGVALLASEGNETRAAVDGEAAQMNISKSFSSYVIIAGSSLGVAGVMLVLVWAFRKVNRPRERAPWESLKDDDYMGYHSIDDNALRFGSRANFLTPEMMAQMAAFSGGGSGMGGSTVDSSDYGDGSIKIGADLHSGTESNTDDGTDAPPHQPEQTWSSMFANDLLVNGINRHGFGKERNTGSSAVGPPIPKSKRPNSHVHGLKPPGRSQFQQHSKAKGVRFSENPSPSQKLNDWTAGRERASPLRQTRRGLPASNGNQYHDDASIAKRAAGGSPHYAQLNENRMRRPKTEYFQVDQLSANPYRSAPVNPQLYEHRNGVMDDLNLDFFETETLVGQSRAKSGKVRGIVEQAIVEVDENGSNVPFPFRRFPTGLAPAPPYPKQVSFGVNATRANDLSGRTSRTVASATASQLLQAQQDEISYTFENGTSGGGGDDDDEESYSLIDGDEGANVVPTVQMQSTFTFGRTESSEGAQIYGDSTADNVAVRTGIHGRRTGTRRIRRSSSGQPGYMLAGGDTLIAEFDADADAEAILQYSMDDVMARLQSPGRTPLGPNSRPSSVYSVEGLHDLKSETNDSEFEFPTEDIEDLWAGLGQAQAKIDWQRATGAGSPWMTEDAEGVYATATTATAAGGTGTRQNPLFEEEEN